MKTAEYFVFALVLLWPSACYGIIHDQRTSQYLRSHQGTPKPFGFAREDAPWNLLSSDGGLPINIQMMENKVERMIKHNLSRNSATPFGNAGTEIKDLLTTMEAQVNSSHQNRQTSLHEACEVIAACGTTLDGSLQTVPQVHSQYEAESAKHKTCRGEEAQLNHSHTQCAADVLAKEGLAATACSLSAQVSGNAETAASQMTQGSGETVEAFLQRVRALVGGCDCNTADICVGGGGGLLDKVRCARKECEDTTADHNAIKLTCATTETEYESKQSACGDLQDNMDAVACESATLSNTACETYNTCSGDKDSAYETTKGHVKDAEAVHKLEWRAIQRIGCLLSALDGDAKIDDAKIQACKTMTHNTDHLNIDYECEKNSKTCAPNDLFPGTPAYQDAEFAVLPPGAKGKPVQPCIGASAGAGASSAGGSDGGGGGGGGGPQTTPLHAEFHKWTFYEHSSVFKPSTSTNNEYISGLAIDQIKDHLYVMVSMRGVVYRCIGSALPAIFAGTPVEDASQSTMAGIPGDAKAASLGNTRSANLAWDPDGKALYIQNRMDYAVFKVESSTGEISLFLEFAHERQWPRGAAIYGGIFYTLQRENRLLGFQLSDGQSVLDEGVMGLSNSAGLAVNTANGMLWIMAGEGGVFAFDTKSRTFTERDGTMRYDIRVIAEDPYSKAMLAGLETMWWTNADGSWKGTQWDTTKNKNGNNENVQALCVSRSGVVYAGTYGGELYIFGLRN